MVQPSISDKTYHHGNMQDLAMAKPWLHHEQKTMAKPWINHG